MNKSRISKIILSRNGGIHSFSNSFVGNDFEHVVNGVCLEYVPDGVYVWKLVFPLYDNFGFNLLYSERLPGNLGYINTSGKSEEQIVDAIHASGAFDSLSKNVVSMGVPEFVAHLEGVPGLLNNCHARMIYACSLMLIWQAEKAVVNLKLAESGLRGGDLDDHRRLVDAFHQGRGAALVVLNEFKRRTFGKLGIKGVVLKPLV